MIGEYNIALVRKELHPIDTVLIDALKPKVNLELYVLNNENNKKKLSWFIDKSNKKRIHFYINYLDLNKKLLFYNYKKIILGEPLDFFNLVSSSPSLLDKSFLFSSERITLSRNPKFLVINNIRLKIANCYLKKYYHDNHNLIKIWYRSSEAQKWGITNYYYHIPNFVRPLINEKKFYGINKNKKIENNEIRILTISRQIPLKGLHLLAIILKKYTKKYNEKIYWINFGEGPLYNKIKHYLRGSQVIFKNLIGEISVNILREADLFLQLSSFEATGIAPIEALSAGLPVVTTYVGGMKDLKRDNEKINELFNWTSIEKNGLMFLKVNKINIIKNIEILLQNFTSINKKKARINALQRYNDLYSWKKMKAKYYDLFIN